MDVTKHTRYNRRIAGKRKSMELRHPTGPSPKKKMGNVLLRVIEKHSSKHDSTDHDSLDHGHYGVSAQAGVGVSALVKDLLHFEDTSEVPEGLNEHVKSSIKAQANWYTKLLQALMEEKTAPKTPEEASRLIIHTLKGHQKADVNGLLEFYGLPPAHALVDQQTTEVSPSLSDGVKFELHSLPVDAKAVADGDTVTVYVSVSDPREASLLPKAVKDAAAQRTQARAQKNYTKADALHKQIIGQNYRMIDVQNEEVLAKKYRIRLRGIDSPESKMPYGSEAKQELLKLVEGKCLRVLVYGEDRYGRCVGDIYCNGIFAQEKMLKKGLAWHYAAYDHRAELVNWEKGARAKRVGLWASPNPEEPWNYRKNKRQGK